MHAVLTPVGSSGDINPFLTIGRALRGRGHDVTLLAPEPFVRPAVGAGLEFVSTWSADDYDRITKDPDLWHPTRGVRLVFRTVGQHLRRAYALLEQVYQPGRSVFIGHTLAFSSRVFEEVHRVPSVTVHLAPNLFRSEFRQPVLITGRDLSVLPRWMKQALRWAIDRLALDPHIVPVLNTWREELGLPPVSRLCHRWIHSPQRVLGLFPEWFGDPQPDWPTQLVMPGFVMADDGQAPDLHAGRSPECFDMAELAPLNGERPLVFTPGSANRQAAPFFRAAVEASRQLGRDALLVTGYREHLPASLPSNVRHVPYAAFSTLFPQAAAVVHHGGIGTTAKAFAAGVPQLIMPMGFDQPDNAGHVVRLGVGAALAPAKFTGPRVAETIGRLLSDASVRDACRQYRERVRVSNALERSCEIIEAVADRSSRK